MNGELSTREGATASVPLRGLEMRLFPAVGQVPDGNGVESGPR